VKINITDSLPVEVTSMYPEVYFYGESDKVFAGHTSTNKTVELCKLKTSTMVLFQKKQIGSTVSDFFTSTLVEAITTNADAIEKLKPEIAPQKTSKKKKQLTEDVVDDSTPFDAKPMGTTTTQGPANPMAPLPYCGPLSEATGPLVLCNGTSGSSRYLVICTSSQGKIAVRAKKDGASFGLSFRMEGLSSDMKYKVSELGFSPAGEEHVSFHAKADSSILASQTLGSIVWGFCSLVTEDSPQIGIVSVEYVLQSGVH
jgi:hypothetical protein